VRLERSLVTNPEPSSNCVKLEKDALDSEAVSVDEFMKFRRDIH